MGVWIFIIIGLYVDIEAYYYLIFHYKKKEKKKRKMSGGIELRLV